MAYNEFELKLHERTVRRFVGGHRPSPELRDRVDLGFRIENQSVEIIAVQPRWRHPGQTTEQAIAKANCAKKSGRWKVSWPRADLRWHRFDPDPEVDSLDEYLPVVDRDEYCAFFG